MLMYVDIVGACNLECPSCPMGNSDNNNFKKAMPLEMFVKIVEKARREGVNPIHLYNWTEPLIHPRIDDFIRVIKAAGISSGVSSNLNVSKNMEKAILAEPDFFRISLSGFYQETYEKGHVGGNVEVVKENMVRLSELKRLHNIETVVEVYYHRYLDNLEEEVLMREFSERLGFKFSAGNSIMMPLEKVLDIIDGSPAVRDSDRETLKRLALPPSGDLINLLKHYPKHACSLKDDMVVLDCGGDAVLCCALFDQSEFSLGKYLDFSMGQLSRLKSSEKKCVELCGKCMQNGLHTYSMLPNVGVMQNYAVRRLIEAAKRKSLNLPVDSEALGCDAQMSREEFDEVQYLKLHPDVQAAVAGGHFSSGYQHYLLYGQFEGRAFRSA